MIFLIVVTNGYVLLTLIGAQAEKYGICFPLKLYVVNESGAMEKMALALISKIALAEM